MEFAVKPAFEDIQRAPPDLSEGAATYLIKNDRHVADWIVETRRKCEKFGCQK